MTEARTVRLVIVSIAAVTVIALLTAGALAYRVLGMTPIDSAAVALLAGFTGLAGTGLGSLGTLLATTRSTNAATPDGTPASPLAVTLPDEPVSVVEVDPALPRARRRS